MSAQAALAAARKLRVLGVVLWRVTASPSMCSTTGFFPPSLTSIALCCRQQQTHMARDSASSVSFGVCRVTFEDSDLRGAARRPSRRGSTGSSRRP
jgi:hypothetical protein